MHLNGSRCQLPPILTVRGSQSRTQPNSCATLRDELFRPVRLADDADGG